MLHGSPFPMQNTMRWYRRFSDTIAYENRIARKSRLSLAESTNALSAEGSCGRVLVRQSTGCSYRNLNNTSYCHDPGDVPHCLTSGRRRIAVGFANFTKDKMISKSQLIEMFANMRAQPPWDVDADLLWGYFFNNSLEPNLKRLADLLVRAGYRLVEIRRD